MMRDLLRPVLSDHPEALLLTGAFEATLHFREATLTLSRREAFLTLSGPDEQGRALRIRYCLDRNWLPLMHSLESDESCCDEDDLWEQSDLAYVLEADCAWAAWLKQQLPVKVEVVHGR